MTKDEIVVARQRAALAESVTLPIKDFIELLDLAEPSAEPAGYAITDEPTREMISKGWLTAAGSLDRELLKRVYKAMRAAAPAITPAPEQDALDDARYRFAAANLVLAGGTRKYRWAVAPVSKAQWDGYIDSEMPTTKSAGEGEQT